MNMRWLLRDCSKFHLQEIVQKWVVGITVSVCAREGKTPLHEMLQPLLLYKCREGSQTVALVFS